MGRTVLQAATSQKITMPGDGVRIRFRGFGFLSHGQACEEVSFERAILWPFDRGIPRKKSRQRRTAGEQIDLEWRVESLAVPPLTRRAMDALSPCVTDHLSF